jgi:hypothetical protein
MVYFTLRDNQTRVSEVRMHARGRKRLHLAGTDARAHLDAPSFTSSNAQSVTVGRPSINDGPRGIWAVDIVSVARGRASVQAVAHVPAGGRETVSLPVTVVDRLVLPDAGTDHGLMVRLFLAENRSPDDRGYEESETLTSMRWMRHVLQNRLRDRPERFNARGATTLVDIVRAPGQFAGFGRYPTIAAAKQERIDRIVDYANDDNHRLQLAYERLVNNASAAVTERQPPDPCPGGLYGWRTSGSADPGGTFVRYQALAGNQFYTVSR